MNKLADIDESSISVISSNQANYYRIIPVGYDNEILKIITDTNTDIDFLKDEIEMLINLEVKISKAESSIIELLLDKHYNQSTSDNREQNAYFKGSPETFLNYLINEARDLNSSDIHIETYETNCRVRIRIDGKLIQRYLLDKIQYPALINKIKIHANLDIAEKRLPQDGRILFETEKNQFDIRVSVLPTLYGEKIVLRLLNQDSSKIDINTLGFSDTDLNNFMHGIKKPNGILLISGPTGSGKTTTLYATLKHLNKDSRNIITIEDPIEYTLQGVNQVQLKENIGLTFPSALRTFLRQDPDIIMLGEIRDPETANMAIRAALTGHLVLSTIHTNSAWGVVSRLIDMGLPPYLLANTLNTVVAQRLIRKLCPNCKIKENFSDAYYPRGFKPSITISHHYLSKGCSKCFNTGYKGRKAVYEVIPIDELFAEQIRISSDNIEQLKKENGIKSLAENAFDLFVKGETSLEEISVLLMN